MGFDRAFPPGTRSEDVIEALDGDFAARAEGRQKAEKRADQKAKT